MNERHSEMKMNTINAGARRPVTGSRTGGAALQHDEKGSAMSGRLGRMCGMRGLLRMAVMVVIVMMSTFLFGRAEAAVTVGTEFSTTNVAIGAGTAMTAISGTFTVGAGSNRLLVVVAQWEAAAATNTSSFTSGTWGGQNLTSLTIYNSGTSRNRQWVGYMKEAQIAAAGSTTLNLNIANSATPSAWQVKAAWFSDVDQTTPINHFVNTNNEAPGAATHTFGATALNVINGGIAYYFETANSGPTYTPPATGYTERYDASDAGANFRATAGSKPIAANGTENPTITQSAATRYTVTAISLNPYVCPDPDPSTITIPGSQTATGSPYDASTMYSKTGDVGTIEYMVTGTDPPAAIASELFTDGTNGNTGTDLQAAALPPANNTTTVNGAWNGGDYAGVSAEAGTTLAINGGFGESEAVQIALTIDQTPATITSIDVKLSAYASAGVNLTQYIWNRNTSTWTQISVLALTTTDQSFSTNFVGTGNFSDYVNASNIMYLQFVTAASGADPDFDFISVDVNYDPLPTTCTAWTGTALIPATTADGSLCGDYAAGTYVLNVRGTDPDCGDSVTTTPTNFTWNACSETATVNVTDPGAMTGPTAITVTLGGSGGSNPQWSPDGGANWYNSGATYTPPSCASGTVTFTGRATGSCGPITDPTPVNNQSYNTTDGDVATLTAGTVPGTPVSGTTVIYATVGVEGAPSTLTGVQAVVAGSTSCNGTLPMSWSAGNSRFEASWNTAACGNPVENGVTINVSGTDPDCSTLVNAGQVTVSIDNMCTETGTVTLNALPNPITGAVAVSATLGGGATVAEVSFDGGGSWVASGSTYTPTAQANYTVGFAARATGSCGGPITDPANPTTVNVDTRTNGLEANSASAAQLGLTSIAVTMSYCGDKDGDATYQVDYKLASSGTWTLGTPQTDATNNGSYTTSLTGLTTGETYDVRMTYADPDGILAGTAVQSATVTLVAWADSPMLHNALRFACSVAGYSDQTGCEGAGGTWNVDGKYTGGWGIPGQQYGGILCGTCHVKNSTNIKRVITPVTAPSGSFPGSTVSFTTAVDGTSDFGNDTAGHNSSTKVCEVCHTKTSYHRYNTNAAPAQANLGHYNQADCFKCHEHKGGFRASCTACHGNPPLSDAELVYNLNAVNDTGSRTWGEHDVHVNTRGYTCNTCHNGWETTGEMPKAGNINIGFNAFSKPAGTYNGRTVGNGGKYTASGTTVNLTMASGTTTCAFYCHGYQVPAWNPASTAACGACHGLLGSYGDDRAGAPTGVANSKDLSGATTGYKVGKHANHLNDSIAATGDPCALCHDGFGYSDATHVDGTVNVTLNAAAGASATFTAGSPGTCTNLDCHGDVAWDSALTGGCDFCHGYPPNTTNNKHASGVVAVNHEAAGITTNHDQCSYCHGVKDNGTGAMTAMATSVLGGAYTYVEATDHIDGKVTMNGNANATGGDDAGYSTANAGCSTTVCHLNDATHRLTTGGAANVQLRDFGPGKCSSCHDTGVNSAPIVSSASTHTRVTTGGAFGDCTNCHAGHSVAIAGGVDIPNSATVGINYATTGHAGIQLGGAGTAVNINGVATADLDVLTTEAEICWTCHDAQTTKISEWGANANASTGNSAYNYGTLTTPNWTTATWSSSRTQYAYKSGAIQSTHTANSTVTDANLTGAAYGYTETKNTVAQIRCAYCHDVHELAKATGDKKEGMPLLRGSWMGNPYEEDGAPRSLYANTTYFTNYNFPTQTYGWGAVPRGSTQQAKLGGYWIDQNNVRPMTALTTGVGTAARNPTATWEPLDTNGAAGNATDASPAFAGVCLLCHGTGATTALKIDGLDQKTGEALWIGTNGHANSVKGGTGATSANSANVFDARLGVTTYGHNPRQHYNGMSDPGDNGTYGFRAASGIAYTPAFSSSRGYGWNVDEWVVDETGATKENGYHKFSCSKCHNPHASRLPKLMITNCLDTVHNTWDNQFQLNGQTGNNLNTELAQWTSAQNCHRYSQSNNATTTVPEYRATRVAGPAGTGAGWNKVTPWKQTANVP